MRLVRKNGALVRLERFLPDRQPMEVQALAIGDADRGLP